MPAAFINRHLLAFLLFCLFLLFSLAVTTGSTQAEQPSPIFVMDSGNAQPQDDFKHVSWALAFKDGKLEITIQTSFPEDKDLGTLPDPLVWEYRIEIDGFLVKEGFETNRETTVREMVALASVPEGTHEISLAIRDTAGKLRRQSKTFEFNTTPKITIQPQEAPPGTFDPLITLSFLQLQPDLAGTADLFIDNQRLTSLAVTAEQNNIPQSLSQLVGNNIYLADREPGRHLLIVEARGLNGSFARLSSAFDIEARKPEITLQRDKKNLLQSIEVTFPPSSHDIVGSVDIHVDHATILSVHVNQAKLQISRQDILDAFTKHQREQPAKQVPIIVSAIGRNNSQNWQEVLFD